MGAKAPPLFPINSDAPCRHKRRRKEKKKGRDPKKKKDKKIDPPALVWVGWRYHNLSLILSKQKTNLPLTRTSFHSWYHQQLLHISTICSISFLSHTSLHLEPPGMPPIALLLWPDKSSHFPSFICFFSSSFKSMQNVSLFTFYKLCIARRLG